MLPSILKSFSPIDKDIKLTTISLDEYRSTKNGGGIYAVHLANIDNNHFTMSIPKPADNKLSTHESSAYVYEIFKMEFSMGRL